MAGAALVVWTGTMHALTLGHFDLKTHEVGSGRDRFLSGGRRGEPVQHILAQLEADAEPGDTLAVFPEGAMLNFLPRRANPTPYANFMPVALDVFGEEAILAAFQEHPPDFIVITHKNTAEFAAYNENGRQPQLHFFGREYGRALMHWIVTECGRVLQAGVAPLTDERFGMDLLRRKTGGGAR